MPFRDQIDTYFHISARGTTIGTEIRAGTASFLTLSYLLLVNPQLLSQAGVHPQDAVFATALSASTSCFIIGFGGNLPFGCAPGLGLSAYLVYGLVQADLCSLADALTACFWSGWLVLLVTLTGISQWLMHIVPRGIQSAIVVGMGLLIAMIGMVTAGIIQANASTLVQLGPVLSDFDLQLCLVGILVVGSLVHHKVQGAILVSIVLLTLFSWTWHSTWPASIVDIPHIPAPYITDLWVVFGGPWILWTAMGAFVLICIFDISGVLFGLSTLAGILQGDSEVPGSKWAFIASGVGTILASLFGSTPIIVCVECASGVREGGRTGLTSVVMGCYFLVSLVLAPLFGSVPVVATSPVLVLVGVLMIPEAAKINWDNISEALPAFLCLLGMPLTYSITNGIILGLVMSMGFYMTTGQIGMDIQQIWNNWIVSSGVLGPFSRRSNDENIVSETGLLTESKEGNKQYEAI